MFLMVTFIATLIHLYSMGYMHDDPRYPRFFAYFRSFASRCSAWCASGERVHGLHLLGTGGRLLLSADRLLVRRQEELLTRPTRRSSSTAWATSACCGPGPALVEPRHVRYPRDQSRSIRDDAGGKLHAIGPAGSWDTVVQLVGSRHGQGHCSTECTGLPRRSRLWALALAGLGIFAGCVGKSAQFPLHVWLPDAMAGPTPVSALIHAATMVAAGVYLVGRFYPAVHRRGLLYIAYTGGITLFIAATIAVVQTDYKKVLAYSTVSQLGFMMLGLGVGGWAAGLFHLLTHAFFKASCSSARGAFITRSHVRDARPWRAAAGRCRSPPRRC